MRIRLDHVLERAALFADRGRDALDADRAAVEFLDDREQQLAIEGIEALRVDFQQVERGARDGLIDVPVRLHLRVVAHAAQQPVGDARRAARALAQCGARRSGSIGTSRMPAERVTMRSRSSTP